jgi:hypothetical protein
MKTEDFDKLYPALAHAIQTGTAQTMEIQNQAVDKGEISASQPGHSPKMLRTGINMAMVEQSAVAKLLIDKGIITEEEYRQALIDGLQAEKDRFEAQLSEHYGTKISLA